MVAQGAPALRFGAVHGVPVFFDPELLKHDTGPHHPENARRVESAVAALRREGFRVESPPAPERTLAAIERVHPPGYVRRLAEACSLAPPGTETAFSLFDSPDNPISPASFGSSVRAVSLALAAVDTVLARTARAVFVAARPPGHHALASEAMGFCFFNTIAVAARDLIATHGLARVLVADFDVHHGNGTQHLFWEDPQVAYVSVHRFPFFPGTGSADEAGAGRGRGTTANVPLPAGTGDTAYAGGFVAALERISEKFRPEFVLVSAGFDAHRNDPIGGMCVSTEGFGWMTRALEDVANVFAGGRVVSILEGGYDEASLGASAAEHLVALSAADGLS